MSTERLAGVAGDPVEHSLSPVLHRAAYTALGFDGWDYRRVRCAAAELPEFVDGLDECWVGLSVTMPCKRAALELAGEATQRARAVGAANTLVRTGSGWLADCTDVDGVAGALRHATGFRGGQHAVVLGAGGTAAAAAVAFAELGVRTLTLVVREPARAGETAAAAERAGLGVRVLRWADADFARLAAGADVLVSTVPSTAVAPHAAQIAEAAALLDVIYHPWPTPLAAVASRLGTGLDMLLHQSFGQVEQFTGLLAPRETMRAALRDATGTALDLPLAPRA